MFLWRVRLLTLISLVCLSKENAFTLKVELFTKTWYFLCRRVCGTNWGPSPPLHATVNSDKILVKKQGKLFKTEQVSLVHVAQPFTKVSAIDES